MNCAPTKTDQLDVAARFIRALIATPLRWISRLALNYESNDQMH
jgi:hypothetical protein